MKKTNLYILIAIGTVGVLALTTKLTAGDGGMSSCGMGGGCCGGMTTPTAADVSTNATPDLLATCPVSGEKLDGDMGKPFVFTYKDQEVKLCCKSCKKDFDKDPEKYITKIRAADKK
jgi:YHS domain-containing protein